MKPRLNLRRRAFTLIELMVVVLILAILAALVVPKIVGNADKAKVSAANSDITAYKSMLEHFRLDCDRYPTTEEGLQALRTEPSGLSGKWKGPYADKDIALDPWQHEYIYESNGDTSFTIKSLGSDGQEGGDGYATDLVATD